MEAQALARHGSAPNQSEASSAHDTRCVGLVSQSGAWNGENILHWETSMATIFWAEQTLEHFREQEQEKVLLSAAQVGSSKILFQEID